MDSEAIAIIRVRDNGISGGGDERGQILDIQFHLTA